MSGSVPFWILLLNPLAWFATAAAILYRVSRFDGSRWHRSMTGYLVGPAFLVGERVIEVAADHAHRPAPNAGLGIDIAVLVLFLVCGLRVITLEGAASKKRADSAAGNALNGHTNLLMTALGVGPFMGLRDAHTGSHHLFIYMAPFYAGLILLLALAPRIFVKGSEAGEAVTR